MEQKRCYVGRFNVPITQITTPDTPELTYIFAVYRDQRWSDFIVVPRRHLHDEYSTYQGAAIGRKQWTLRIRFQGTSVICGGRDWTRFRDAWPATNRPPVIPDAAHSIGKGLPHRIKSRTPSAFAASAAHQPKSAESVDVTDLPFGRLVEPPAPFLLRAADRVGTPDSNGKAGGVTGCQMGVSNAMHVYVRPEQYQCSTCFALEQEPHLSHGVAPGTSRAARYRPESTSGLVPCRHPRKPVARVRAI